MSSPPETKDELVQSFVARAATECSSVSPAIAGTFAQRFFQFVPYSDTAAEQNRPLVDSAIAVLKEFASFQGETASISVVRKPGNQGDSSLVIVVQPDSPFLVDSIRMELNRRDLPIRSILSVILTSERGPDGTLTDLKPNGHDSEEREAAICVETSALENPGEIADLKDGIDSVLQDLRLAVSDFPTMRERALAEAANLTQTSFSHNAVEIAEAEELLRWLADDHFVFLGFDEHQILEEDGHRVLQPTSGSALGTMKRHQNLRQWVLDALTVEARNFIETPTILNFVNSTHRSRIHRPVYPDYITIKRFDQAGEIVSACRFLGLFTSSVYNELPNDIPLIRRKVANILERSNFAIGGHYRKALVGVLNAYPRDSLFQASENEIFDTAMGIVQIQETPRVRLFLRRNPYGRFFYCKVFVPKSIYHSELRKKIERHLCQRLRADDVELSMHMGEGELVRLRFVLRVPSAEQFEVDVRELEQEVVTIAQSWDDAFLATLHAQHDDSTADSLFRTYHQAFPSSYREHFSPTAALEDLVSIAELEAGSELALTLQARQGEDNHLSFRLFQQDNPVPLSDVLPIIENMGLRANSEHPYRIQRADGSNVWIHDFHLIPSVAVKLEIERVAELFRDAFINTWRGSAENDGFNALILGACISWREVAMLRAYARYNHQAKFGFGTVFTAETLVRHLNISCLLARFFEARFLPSFEDRAETQNLLEGKILEALDQVPSLNEDRVLRRFLEMMQATIRTNFYQAKEDGTPKDYLSFKFDPSRIPGLPFPRPAYEIFVYSPRFEGIHLRGGKIARGGLRWSDRPEDFRTEVLGLVKAQQVKNAVIVPVGAKGGFVAHQLPTQDRSAMMEEGKACYRNFLRGLLDLTDNLAPDGKIIPPPNVERHDPDDPYLVVAADKGTATFSDIGNSISEEYGFWLGDAFASGGSEGYDHKKMGITAKGAWVSVQRHFGELGIDVQREPITVVGIGDMAGDVFGNGMLCSEQIQLIAAFNHLHIFIDPDPDPATSFAERKRLFEAVAGWGQYDTDLLSSGGAIYSREQKVIELSPQAKERFQIEADKLTPAELITELLKSKVDLLWNGGIGTFAKSSHESHEDAGDRNNDALRVDGKELQCRVIGEGGNLGFTQLARVEFSLRGGSCNTDFIDNSAGVDCSDHEVNLKIPLNRMIAEGSMTRESRNELLSSMTEAVGALVLHNNYRQTRAISLAQAQSAKRTVEYIRLLENWERRNAIDRKLEGLPDNEALAERVSRGQALTRPELSVLIAYNKSMLKQELVESDVPDDPFMSRLAEKAFPAQFVDQYREQLNQHQLRREIVATQWANDMVNLMGPSYTYRLEESTGATSAEITRAYAAAREIFSLNELWGRIEALDFQVEPKIQHQMMYEVGRLVRRGSRWLVRNFRDELADLPSLVKRFRPGVQQVAYSIHSLLHDAALKNWEKNFHQFTKAGVPEDLASTISASSGLYSSFGVIFAAEQTEESVDNAAEVYYSASDYLDLHWLSYRIRDLGVEDHWQARARESFRDELHIQQRQLTINILRDFPKESAEDRILKWGKPRKHYIKRWKVVLEEFRAAGSRNYAMFPVVLRELAVLVENSVDT